MSTDISLKPAKTTQRAGYIGLLQADIGRLSINKPYLSADISRFQLNFLDVSSHHRAASCQRASVN
jgi:hypothetical protein